MQATKSYKLTPVAGAREVKSLQFNFDKELNGFSYYHLQLMGLLVRDMEDEKGNIFEMIVPGSNFSMIHEIGGTDCPNMFKPNSKKKAFDDFEAIKGLVDDIFFDTMNNGTQNGNGNSSGSGNGSSSVLEVVDKPKTFGYELIGEKDFVDNPKDPGVLAHRLLIFYNVQYLVNEYLNPATAGPIDAGKVGGIVRFQKQYNSGQSCLNVPLPETGPVNIKFPYANDPSDLPGGGGTSPHP